MTGGPPVTQREGGGPPGAGAPALGVPSIAGLLEREGPARHAWSAARGEASDAPVPVFEVRGLLLLFALSLYVEGRPGVVTFEFIGLDGEPRELLATRLPMRPLVGEVPVVASARPGGHVLRGPGSLYCLDPAGADARLWSAYWWPLSPGGRLEGVEP